MSYTKQVSHQLKKIRKQKFIMALVKQHLSLDMQTIKKFNNIKYQTDTGLSNEYWNIVSAKKIPNISWEILEIHKSYNQSSKRCLLCFNEKLAIALHKDDNILNKRSEVISKCRHGNKYMLANYDSKD